MSEYTYVIPGNPIPLKRPRFAKGHVYDPQEDEKSGTWMIIRQQQKGPMLLGPVHLKITFFMNQPQRHKGKLWHRTKPDLSNLVKFYEDVCTGILYYDDKQVVKITAEKMYDENPRTVLTVILLKESND